MKTIYLVRHGEAEINPTHDNLPTHYKGGDAELTPRGLIQAGKIAERVANLPIQAIVASTMVRAQQTAEVISKEINLPIESSDLFTERRNPKSFIGLEWADPETQRLEAEWVRTFFVEDARLLDGENFQDMDIRAKQALAFLSKRPEDHILVVTHGFFMRFLLARVVFREKNSPQIIKSLEKGFRTANTGLTLIHYDPADTYCEWYISLWNDHAHLG